MKKLVVMLLLLATASAYGEIYTWKDARGTVFYTNSLHEIPARYRTRAKLLDVATGKKLPIGTPAPEGPGGAGATPGQAPAPQTPSQQTPAQQPAAPQTAAQPSPAPANSAAQATGAVAPQPRLTRAQRRAQQRQNVAPEQHE